MKIQQLNRFDNWLDEQEKENKKSEQRERKITKGFQGAMDRLNKFI